MEISDLPINDSLGVTVTSFRKGKAYSADPFSLSLFEVNNPVREYAQNFNEGTDDFEGDLFLITKFNGFDDFAIHTRHPYEEGINYSGDSIDYLYQLRTPIIVASNNASLKYEDIALVEKGEIGAVFPSDDFYDYVVVEGSDDGVNWKTLSSGYDAQKNAKWLDAYNLEKDGDKSLFMEHTIDILNTFQAGDTIFIRFKLHSDPLTAGWGWAIDNVFIQQKITAIERVEKNNLSCNIYPNPITGGTTNVNFSLDKKSKVSIKVLDIKGQVLWGNDFGYKPKGSYNESINLSNLANGIYVMRIEINNNQITKKIIVR
jgi:hypothetical protein